MTRKWKAYCEDGWSSQTVEADSAEDASDKLAGEYADHLKLKHNNELNPDPFQFHKQAVDHIHEAI